jgi:hypothetical protein
MLRSGRSARKSPYGIDASFTALPSCLEHKKSILECYAKGWWNTTSAIYGDCGRLLALLLERLDYRNQYPVVPLRSTTGYVLFKPPA